MKKIMLVICMLSAASLCRAQAPPSLGSAASFSALAGGPADGAVTCTTSTLTGDVGVSPGSAVTGFPAPCTDVGAVDAANAVALQAHRDAALAYAALAADTCGTNLTLSVRRNPLRVL